MSVTRNLFAASLLTLLAADLEPVGAQTITAGKPGGATTPSAGTDAPPPKSPPRGKYASRSMDAPRLIAIGGSEAAIVDLTGMPSLVASHSLPTGGQDVALTQDGRIAIVRAGSEVRFLNLNTGSQMGGGIAIAGTAGSDDSDWVVATNNRAVVLGGNQALVLDLSTKPPSVLSSHTILDGGHDIALGAANKLAVVRSGSAVQYFELQSGLQLGSGHLLSGGCGVGDSDWVAATPRRAIVTGGDEALIISLETPTPTLLGVHSIETGGHDVTLGFGGRTGIVRSGDRVQYFNLITGNELGSGHTLAGAAAAGSSDWAIGTMKRALVTGGNQALILDLTERPPALLASHALGSGAHDAAQSPGGKLAAVRSANLVQYFDLISGAELGTGHVLAGSGTASDADWVALTKNRAVVTGGGQMKLINTKTSPPVVIGSHAVLASGHDIGLSVRRKMAIVRSGTLLQYFSLQSGAEIGTGHLLAGTGGASDSDLVSVR